MKQEMPIDEIISKVLEEQVVPALGCTESVALGLATSIAYNAIRGKFPTWIKRHLKKKFDGFEVNPENIDEIFVKTDPNTWKNALNVGVPGSQGKYGHKIAIALGVFCVSSDDPKDKLMLFNDPEIEKKSFLANKLVEKKGKIKVVDLPFKKPPDEQAVYVESKVKAKDENGRIHEGIAVIEHNHTNVTSVEVDTLELLEKRGKPSNRYMNALPSLFGEEKLSRIVDAIEKLLTKDKELIKRISDAIYKNKKASELGMGKKAGLRVGFTFQKLIDEGRLSGDLANYSKVRTAAATDARMAGENVTVMTCAGSGNLGLMASLPIITVAEGWRQDKERMIKAVALSFLITCYVTRCSGVLSAFCGCAAKAGVGAAAGVTYYLGGNAEQIGYAINNIAGNITGMICDGAKEGCAMKLATAAGVAVESAFLALENVKICPGNGIVFEKPPQTIQNIGEVATSMVETDKAIVKILKKRGCFKKRNFSC